MKKLTKPAAIFLFSISVLALGIGVVPTSSAEDISIENLLLQKLDALVGQLAKLTENSASSSEDAAGNPASTGIQQLQLSAGLANPSCLDNYGTWPTSNTYNSNAAWQTDKFASGSSASTASPFVRLADVNGDGLLDYLYHKSYTYSHWSLANPVNMVDACLLLNNGAGWDNTYRCHTATETVNNVGVAKYYGDCAQI